MSPERDWKAGTDLKQKYSLRKKLFQKGTFFPLGSIFGIQLSVTTLTTVGTDKKRASWRIYVLIDY